MMIIGCDFHPRWQQVSWLDTEMGDTGERKLAHATGDAEQFYRQLVGPVLIGMEATGNSPWFVELVEDLGHEIWIGDAAQIRASYVRKQKTDKRDVENLRFFCGTRQTPHPFLADTITTEAAPALYKKRLLSPGPAQRDSLERATAGVVYIQVHSLSRGSVSRKGWASRPLPSMPL
jgi:hypothetical protein